MLELQSAAGRSVFEDAQKWEGQVLANGNFRLRRYLGGSDHSAVFLTDIGVGQIRPPAIKLTAADPANTDIQLARWKAAAKLGHPNLLQIFDSGRCQLNGEELLFVVTENADETLAEILRERSLTPDEAGQMLKPALEALSYLHDSGYSAGRVSPSNIMAIGEQVKLSSDGTCRSGTPALFREQPYDPPEVSLEGLTPAGDIWDLGMTIVQTLTQRLPIWNDRLRDEPTPPDSLPEPFSDIVRHCLVRDPRSRWTIADIKSRVKQPAVQAPVSEQPRDVQADVVKSTISTRTVNPTGMTKALATPERLETLRRVFHKYAYAIPILVMLVALLVFAGLLLRHRASSEVSQSGASEATPSESSAPQPTAAAPTASQQPSHEKASARRNAPQPKIESSSAVAGDVVHRVVPTVPEKALRTIHGKVRVNVKVTVDASGNVTGADIASSPSRYFGNIALEAARDWKFGPGSKVGQIWLIQFVFENSGVTASARRLASGG